MINFASLFGSFNRGGNSAINDLLQKKTTTLEQLLDVDTFPNQYKSGNSKIMELSMDYQKYQALINYVTVEGPADNQKKGYKFPMVAADVLSTQNNTAIDFFLPEGDIFVDVVEKVTEQFEVQVDDNDDEDYLTEQTTQQTTPQQTPVQEPKQENTQQQTNSPQTTQPQTQQQQTTTQPQQPKEQQKPVKQKKKKIIKQQRVVSKTRKQKRDPLISNLLSYYQGPINYTLAGYNCKVLSTLFSKKPANFFNLVFKSDKNYIEALCNHIESKSVGDLITKILVWENSDFLEERIKIYNHMIYLMSQLKESHVISNLAYTISEIIEKSSSYIKSKANISNNQEIIQTFLKIFYRTSEVHKIINNAMAEDQNKSAYNCLVLHSYLHHTEIETVNSFKIEEVLESFITKASDKLRDIPNRRTLGMGRVKIVEIFSYLVRKQPKTIQDENRKNELTTELLQELYIHTIIAKVDDFFSILLKLVQSFQNNNILHNEVFKILESVLKQPQQNKSALQQLLLNDENVLLKFIVAEAQKDKQLRTVERPTKRKGYIGHVINLCRLIDSIQNNELLNQKIKQTPEFQEVLNTLIAVDITETNKSLAGYLVKKNPAHEVMFQKEDILAAYSDFLTHCPKPQFQPEEPQEDEDTTQPITIQTEQSPPKGQQTAEKALEEQERDQQKYNEVVAFSHQEVDQSNPKFWITHIDYDVEALINDL